jgi:hypothetical protein
MTFTPASTIEEVIHRLEVIITHCIETENRIGYFAALYNRVTQTVKHGISQGNFEDGPRMERLDVIFANRFLAAYAAYHAGEPPTRSWLLKFEKAQKDSLCVLQHLMLGMAAHIHLDLGISAAITTQGAEHASLRNDFNAINDVLASLVPVVEDELESFSPHFRGLLELARTKAEHLANFAMGKARDDAWAFSRSLADQPRSAWAPLIAKRDDATVELGIVLTHGGILSAFLHAHESTNISANIEALAAGEFDFGHRNAN